MVIGRRSFCSLLAAGAVLGAAVPYARADPRSSARFRLGADVLDGGQQVTSLQINTASFGRIAPSGLSTDTFSVHARAVSPVPVQPGDLIFSEYDEDRVITDVSMDERGAIMIDFTHGYGVTGANTLGYLLSAGRNLGLKLTYTITQNRPLSLVNGSALTIGSFTQGGVLDPEVDRFGAGSAAGINYRLAPPRPGTVRGKPGLVVWLHGAGEGGLGDYQDNSSTLQANRGALGPATVEAQRILGGAYVLAPQCPVMWLAGDYTARLKQLIDEVVASHGIDPSRIWVMGCSAGGYQTVQLATHYPDFFAAAVPTCPAIDPAMGLITEQQLLRMADTPTWFVHAVNDDTVPYETTSVWAHDLLPDSILTAYPDVTWQGVTYPSHWSWIYTARNDPHHGGQSLWEWMADQSR